MDQQRPLGGEAAISVPSADSHGTVDAKPVFPGSLPSLQPKKKKPGPKRDSKPASSEKLERNRQAQRTHRERKEQYTKDLELEVMRLKELFSNAARERDTAYQARDQAQHEAEQLRRANGQLHEENERMRTIIQSSASSSGADSAYDITYDATRKSSLSNADGYPGMSIPVSKRDKAANNNDNISVWETNEIRGFASDEALQNELIKVESSEHEMNGEASMQMTPLTAHLPAPTIDYDGLALDFVLTLEKPCMGHIQYLHIRAHNEQPAVDGEIPGPPLEVPDDGRMQHISGHALMATAPPYSHVMSDPSERYPMQFPQDLQREDLMKLLDLSSDLPLDSQELPIVKAWLKIMQDPRSAMLSVDDFATLKENLLNKVHCYRFGAVIDQCDIEDAITQVLSSKATDTAIGVAVSSFGAVNHSPHATNSGLQNQTFGQGTMNFSPPMYQTHSHMGNGATSSILPGTAF